MDFRYIEEQYNLVKSLIKRDKKREALECLEIFIEKISDQDLENKVISLWAKYNSLVTETIKGTSSSDVTIELNKLTQSMMLLLQESKQIAIEKASLLVGSQLSNMAKEGTSAIEDLKALNLIMVESRLMEIQVMNKMFGQFFTQKDQDMMKQNIKDLKAILVKYGKEQQESENRTDLEEYPHNFKGNIATPSEQIENVLTIFSKLLQRNE
jgi:hypothetical protein